ncbi:hypothetical protein C7974DRAFT_404701 [Boeremia exigua]|uniref:uncharacterized protein n=1 Tax=Boeremia exigua TaxID=749465 RepID=UPI001E8E57A1|nr:uncharacterized protein C7974DRAFT_404701 [Boeremia exigua]KAH6614210.1 hypothetical protein C7974DRAFT_404701 [Boeremia exigua]
MLYFIHNPSDNIIIRTNNPLIVLQHQKSGWLTATSLDELLSLHPEWQPKPDPWSARRQKATELVSRACGSVLASLSPTLAFAPSYTPSGAAAMVALLNEGAPNDAPVPAERAGEAPIGGARNGSSSRSAPGIRPEGSDRNSAPKRWMTALEYRWYRDQGLRTPETGWLVCNEGERPFRYRLLFGEWDLDESSEYQVESLRGA